VYIFAFFFVARITTVVGDCTSALVVCGCCYIYIGQCKYIQDNIGRMCACVVCVLENGEAGGRTKEQFNLCIILRASIRDGKGSLFNI